MSLLVGAAANSATGGYKIDNSLRFRASADAYLSRANGSAATLATSGTISMWVKKPRNGSREYLMQTGSGTGNSNYFSLFFTNSTADSIKVGQYSVNGYVNTSALYRDPSAWYHLVMAFDSTESTGTDRVKIYVNGDLTTNTSSAGASSNFALTNNGQTVFIGREGGYPSDTYMSEVHLIDGQTLSPTDFGETDEDTGAWIAKEYDGTYGNNGFYLKFDDTSSVAALGTDSSGNGNDFTPTNISLTAGATYDSMTDVPTLTDEDTANFAVMNPLDTYATTITNGNLQLTGSSAAWGTTRSTFVMPTGSWYCEITSTSGIGNGNSFFGIAPQTTPLSSISNSTFVGGTSTSWAYSSNGNTYTNGSVLSSTGTSWASGSVIGITFDGSTLKFYKNNTLITTISSIPNDNYCITTSFYSSDGGAFNFGQRPFSYTPPSGFKKLNTFNLPDSTIEDGSEYFNTVLYTGTGAIRSVTGVGFQPDWVWGKARNVAYHPNLFDSVRGVGKILYSSVTNVELSDAASLTSFDSDGFSTGADPSAGINYSGTTYVAWNWKAGGTAVSNGDGSITSTVSANPTAGFSVITFTGNGTAGATIGHGLGAVPKFIVVKNRTYAVNWRVYHASLGATKFLSLNLGNAVGTSSLEWNNTTPTSSVITVGTSDNINRNTDDIVMYAFAEVEGYSKFGSYTGNGSTDGTFVYTGFRPSFVMIKRTDSTANWYIYDTTRGTTNAVTPFLNANTADAEQSFGAYDFLSNGFKNRQTNVYFNASGGTYIYMAFAENPFKNSTAR